MTRRSLHIFVTSIVLAAGLLFYFGKNANEIRSDRSPNPIAGETGNLISNYGAIPLHFEANAGQIADEVRFLSRGSGYSLFLTAGEAILAFQRPEPDDEPQQSDVLRMRFAGANSSSTLSGEDLLEGKTNYLIGSDPDKWKTGIANFARVRYSNIYDGVDAVYYGSGQRLEYDLIVAPNISTDIIRFNFDGSQETAISNDGDLVVKLNEHEIRQHKPIAYQEINGERFEVAADYVIDPMDRTAGIAIGAYDHSQPLIIDPVLSYSTYLGGGDETLGTSIAVDSAGSAYVTGYTNALDFPTVNPVQSVNNGGTAGFITKLNPAGTAFVYSTYIGGNSRTFPSSIKVDAAGSSYIGGWTLSSNFPTTVGAYRTTPPPGGGHPSFVTKLSPSGSSLSYSTYFGAVNDLTGLAVDSANNAYLTGYTQDTVFPTTPGAYKMTLGDGVAQNAFVSKLNPTGSALVYSTFVGASVPLNGFQAVDQANAIAVDPSGNAYITGLTISRN